MIQLQQLLLYTSSQFSLVEEKFQDVQEKDLQNSFVFFFFFSRDHDQIVITC